MKGRKMLSQNRDAMFAWSCGLMLIGGRGHTEIEGIFVAEHAGIKVVLHKARSPMLLTIDAPGRVLEIETADLHGSEAKVFAHVTGPWQQALFGAVKRQIPWSDRSWLARPLKRGRSWPFTRTA
jgi:hypothetical protein